MRYKNRHQHNSVWSKEMEDELRTLRVGGMSYGDIAKKLGVTKNQACGKGGRMGIVMARPTRLTGVKPERLPGSDRGTYRGKAPVEVTPISVVRNIIPLVIKPSVRPQPCCWPIGEPRTPEFRFCNDPGEPSKPYCREHCAIAYIPYSRKAMEG